MTNWRRILDVGAVLAGCLFIGIAAVNAMANPNGCHMLIQTQPTYSHDCVGGECPVAFPNCHEGITIIFDSETQLPVDFIYKCHCYDSAYRAFIISPATHCDLTVHDDPNYGNVHSYTCDFINCEDPCSGTSEEDFGGGNFYITGCACI